MKTAIKIVKESIGEYTMIFRDLRELLKEALEDEYGADGLYCDNGDSEPCVCPINDLCLCDSAWQSCVPARLHKDGLLYPMKRRSK